MTSSRACTARAASALALADRRPTIAGGAGISSRTAGAMAAEMWLRQRGLSPPPTTRWHVEIALDVVHTRAPSEFDEVIATRFHLDIYLEEWGVFFCHGGNASWVRVTDVPFVHGRDDFQLLAVLPPLKDVGQLLRQLERT